MRRTVLVLIATMLTALPARARQQPTDLELMVAYCFGVKRAEMGVLYPASVPTLPGCPFPKNLPSSAMKDWRDVCKAIRDNQHELEKEIDRLRMYLLAKDMGTNPAATVFAINSGDADLKTFASGNHDDALVARLRRCTQVLAALPW